MNVFILSGGQDTGGQGARLAEALRKHGHQARAMHQTETYLRYPADLRWDEKEARRLFAEAEVVHLKNGTDLYHRFGGGKPAVVHHHGTRLRTNAAAVDEESRAIGAVQLVSTIDLLADCTGGRWLPSPFDLDWIRNKYRSSSGGYRILIGHAPTNRDAKGTATIERVIERLKADYEIDFDLITQVEWKVCLSRKGRCDIFIDQLTLGYGNNAVEAMALGIPVVSGWAEDEDRERFEQVTGEGPPFLHANSEESLYLALTRLIESEKERASWAFGGRAYAEKYHAADRVIERLIPLYEEAIEAVMA